MKTTISIITLLLIFSTCSENTNCSDFKVGEFAYSDPSYGDWKVIRTDSTQTEISKKLGVEIQSSIEWKSDCEYTLTNIRVLSLDKTETTDITIDVEIIETKADRYICKSLGDTLNLQLEMIKLK